MGIIKSKDASVPQACNSAIKLKEAHEGANRDCNSAIKHKEAHVGANRDERAQAHTSVHGVRVGLSGA